MICVESVQSATGITKYIYLHFIQIITRVGLENVNLLNNIWMASANVEKLANMIEKAHNQQVLIRKSESIPIIISCIL